MVSEATTIDKGQEDQRNLRPCTGGNDFITSTVMEFGLPYSFSNGSRELFDTLVDLSPSHSSYIRYFPG